MKSNSPLSFLLAIISIFAALSCAALDATTESTEYSTQLVTATNIIPIKTYTIIISDALGSSIGNQN